MRAFRHKTRFTHTLTAVFVCCALVGPWITHPSLSKAATAALRWAPPVLTSPSLVIVSQQNRVLNLLPDRDYVIDMPSVALTGIGGLKIIGGRNVVLSGGSISISNAPADATGEERRGLLLKDQTGVVHIEGLALSGTSLSEGIQIASPLAIVQLQNIRVEKVRARDTINFTDNHPDVVQVWGGVRALRINGLTGISDFQGVFLKPDSGTIGSAVIERTNIIGGTTARQLMWKTTSASFPVTVSDVYVKPAPDKTLSYSLYPRPPESPWTTVKSGIPPGGDFVPSGVAGASYVSPYPHIVPTAPKISVTDVAVQEPRPGETKTAWFTVRLSKPSSAKIWVSFTTKAGSAVTPADYTGRSGTVVFAPDETKKVIGVAITADGTTEGQESFQLVVSKPINATIGDGSGTGTISD